MSPILYLRLKGMLIREVRRTQSVDKKGLGLVIHDGRQVIEACPLAEAKGIHEGMTLKESKTLLRDDGHHEKPPLNASTAWLDLAAECSDAVEPISSYQAFVDLSGHPRPDEIAAQLLSRIAQHEKTDIQAGLSSLKWLAQKTACLCDQKALDLGLLPINPVEDAPAYIAAMPVDHVSPLAASVQERLIFLGCRFVHQARLLSPQTLKKQFGKEAAAISAVLAGRGTQKVFPLYPPDSVTESITFPGGADDSQVIDKGLSELAGKLAMALGAADKRAEALRLTAYYEEGGWVSKVRQLGRPMMASFQLLVGMRLLVDSQNIQNPISRIAVRAENLTLREAWQQTLLGQTPQAQRLHALKSATKEVDAMYGDGRVIPASAMSIPRRQRVLNAWRQAIGWR